MPGSVSLLHCCGKAKDRPRRLLALSSSPSIKRIRVLGRRWGLGTVHWGMLRNVLTVSTGAILLASTWSALETGLLSEPDALGETRVEFAPRALPTSPAERTQAPIRVVKAPVTVPETARTRVCKNALLAIEGRVVAAASALDTEVGPVGVTLVDGLTGELVRTEVDASRLRDDAQSWRWWYARHR
jgi:hypothetical protein